MASQIPNDMAPLALSTTSLNLYSFFIGLVLGRSCLRGSLEIADDVKVEHCCFEEKLLREVLIEGILGLN